MAKKILNDVNVQMLQETHILPVVRDANGYLVDEHGMEILDPVRDRRIVHGVNPDKMPKGYKPKSETMKGLIDKYISNKKKLDIELSKTQKDETKIANIHKVQKNLEESLLRNEKFIKSRLNINVSQIISGKIK